MKTFKHLLAKTVSLVLCVSLLAGATVIPVFAAKPRAINHNTVLTVEKIAEDIVTYLENAKMPELLPKDSALAGFEGFSNIGKVNFSIDLASFGANAKADISLHYDTVSNRYAADIAATLPNRAPFTASLYFDAKMLAVRCNELFGSNTYAVEWDTPENMLDKFASSNFAKALGVTDKDIATLKQSEVWQKFASPELAAKISDFLTAYKEYIAGAKEVDKALFAGASVTEDTYKDVEVYAIKAKGGSPEVTAAVKAYAQNQVAYMTTIETFLGNTDQSIAEETIEQFSEFMETALDGLDMTYYLKRDDMSLAGLTALCDMDFRELLGMEQAVVEATIDMDCTDGAYDIRVEYMLPDDSDEKIPMVMTLGLKPSYTYKHTVWDAYLTVGTQDINILNIIAKFDHDETAKAYTLTFRIGSPYSNNSEDSEVVYQFAGGLDVSATSFAVSLESLSVHEPAIILPLSETESVLLREARDTVMPIGISVSYAAAEPVKEPTTYKNLFTLSENEVYALIARVTLNAKKLEDDFRKAVGVALYDEPVDPRVKKLYAIDYDDYENYAEWYSEEEFWDLVDEYQYYIDSNTSY